MADIVLSENTSYFNCVVGDYVKIFRPNGYKGVTYTGGLSEKVYKFGFEILYPALGEFISKTSDDDNQSWVIYHHKKAGEQVIRFTSDHLGTHEFFFVLKGIDVHDHASVYTGGPAFATYYSEPPVAKEEGS